MNFFSKLAQKRFLREPVILEAIICSYNIFLKNPGGIYGF